MLSPSETSPITQATATTESSFDYWSLVLGEGRALATEVIGVAALFCLAVMLFNKNWQAKARSVLPDSWLNIQYVVWDTLLVLPLITYAYYSDWRWPWSLPGTYAFWETLEGASTWVALGLTLLVVDFIDYWRHRVSHMRWLWPIHAIHHSDRALTFLSARRQHPFNRLFSTLCSVIVLTALNVPFIALGTAYVIRTFYTYFIHADIPISYGRLLDHVLISPLHHRWHHHRDPKKANSNFAGMFAFYDWIFGTLHLPQETEIPFGYDHPDYPRYSYIGQLAYPFVAWYKMIQRRIHKRFPALKRASAQGSAPKRSTPRADV